MSVIGSVGSTAGVQWPREIGSAELGGATLRPSAAQAFADFAGFEGSDVRVRLDACATTADMANVAQDVIGRLTEPR